MGSIEAICAAVRLSSARSVGMVKMCMLICERREVLDLLLDLCL